MMENGSEEPQQFLVTGEDTPSDSDIQAAENDWKLNHKLTPELTAIITHIFAQGNPYEILVNALPMCWEFSKARGGQTLCHQFFMVLKEMRDRDEESVSDKHLGEDLLRRIVSTVVKQANNSLFELVCKVFNVNRENAETYELLVVDLMQSNHITEAARLAIQVGLRNEFADRLAMPLVLSDKQQLLGMILEGLPDTQRRVLKIFDDHYDDSAGVRQIVQLYDISSVKKVDRGLFKRIAKLMTRYLKKYNLPPNTCPNLQLSRNRSAMRYLLGKRYQEKDIAENSWREMVIDQVLGYPVLHYELMKTLFQHNDHKCAHYFALKLEFPRKEWPANFVKYVDSLPPGSSPLDELENNNSPSDFLPVELRSDQIQLVCNGAEFEEAASALADAPIIGLDAEWKPAMGLLQKTRLSLIQMATREKVYLLDVLKLSEIITPEEWASFYKRVFDNPSGCILGFGISEDLRKLEALSGTPIYMTYIKDLIIVRDALLSHRPELMDSRVDLKVLKNHNGLSKLTCRLLGYPLDKSEQCSDWENRPLRASQVHYAALDAHCLIRCWEELDRRCKDEDIKLVVEDAIRYRKEQAESCSGKPSDVGHRGNRRGRRHGGGSTSNADHQNIVSGIGIGYQKNHPGLATPSLPDSGLGNAKNARRWEDRASASASESKSRKNTEKANARRHPPQGSNQQWRPRPLLNSGRGEPMQRNAQFEEQSQGSDQAWKGRQTNSRRNDSWQRNHQAEECQAPDREWRARSMNFRRGDQWQRDSQPEEQSPAPDQRWRTRPVNPRQNDAWQRNQPSEEHSGAQDEAWRTRPTGSRRGDQMRRNPQPEERQFVRNGWRDKNGHSRFRHEFNENGPQ